MVAAVQATIFAWSPQVLYRWRAFLLRLFGAKIGKNVVIRPSVKITYPWKLTLGDYAWVGDEVNLYTLGEITIGAHSVISQKVIYAPVATTMQVNISPLTPRLL